MPLNDEDDSVESCNSNSAGPVLGYENESPVVSPVSSSSTSSSAAVTADGVQAGSSSLLTVNVSNLPTLLSKSPPPFDSASLDDRAASVEGDKLADPFFEVPEGTVSDVGVGSGNDFNNLSFQNSTSDSSNTFASLPNGSGDDRTGPPADVDNNNSSSSPAAVDTTNNSNEQMNFFLAPVCDPVLSDKHFIQTTPTTDPTTSSTFQTEFNAFATDDTSATGSTADWVNFDQMDSSAWADPVSTAPPLSSVQPPAEAKTPVSIQQQQQQQQQQKSTTVQTSIDSNDQQTTTANDDDDEWSDFAEPKPFDFKPSIPPPVLPAPPRPPVIVTNTPAPAPVSKSSPLTGQMLIDLDAFLEQIFAKTPASLLAEQDESSSATNRVPTDFPILIDEDLVWQHIQRFTTETDASDSLQFKWKLSDLESSFLSSLCLQRAPSLPKKFKTKSIPSYIYNMSNILQPTKLAESSASATLPTGSAPPTNKVVGNGDKPAETEFEINRTPKPRQADNSSDTSSTKSAPGQQETTASAAASAAILNPSQMLDLDLSFFEKSSSSSSVKSSSSGGGKSQASSATTAPSKPPNLPSGGSKPESNSIYLNKLLQDIFHQPQASSSSSSSPPVPSSNNNNNNSNGGGVVKPSPATAVSHHKKQQDTDKNLLTF